MSILAPDVGFFSNDPFPMVCTLRGEPGTPLGFDLFHATRNRGEWGWLGGGGWGSSFKGWRFGFCMENL